MPTVTERTLRQWDFYRRIHPEFTDATCMGAIFSVLALAAMVALFVLEFNAWMVVDHVSNVQLDTTGIDTFRLNLNISFPMLPCQFLSVDVSDVLGTNRVKQP